MSITSRFFGKTTAGADVTKYTMTNAHGAYVSILDFGGTVNEIVVPDTDGKMADVCLGFDTMDAYNGHHGYMGAIIGRYGNRIRDGKFSIDGVDYQVPLNKDNGTVHLHGGFHGFDSKIWKVQPVEGKGKDSLVLTYVSADGEENYPGNLAVTVTYTWSDANDLSIRYHATTDKPTVVNLTNHTYFNLAGHASGSVGGHVMTINADAITPNDPSCVPTGDYLAVVGTPFDLRYGLMLSEGFDQIKDNEQLTIGHGYDHNFVLSKGCTMGTAAEVFEPESGRVLEVITDQPGVQFFSAGTTNLKGGKGGAEYGPLCAFCLETQHFPDSPNQPQWPSTLLRPGQVYDSTTIYAFRTEDQWDEE